MKILTFAPCLCCAAGKQSKMSTNRWPRWPKQLQRLLRQQQLHQLRFKLERNPRLQPEFEKKIFTIFDELFLETFPKYSAYFCQTLLFDNSENTALQTRPYPLYIAASKKVTPSLSTTTVPTKGKKREDTWASTPSRKTTTPSTPSRTTTEQQKPNAPYYESFMYEYIQKPKQYEYETFAYEYFNTKQRHSKKTRQASLDNQTYLAYLLKLFW